MLSLVLMTVGLLGTSFCPAAAHNRSIRALSNQFEKLNLANTSYRSPVADATALRESVKNIRRKAERDKRRKDFIWTSQEPFERKFEKRYSKFWRLCHTEPPVSLESIKALEREIRSFIRVLHREEIDCRCSRSNLAVGITDKKRWEEKAVKCQRLRSALISLLANLIPELIL